MNNSEFERRKVDAEMALDKYCTKVPVIIKKYAMCTTLQRMPKHGKFILPRDLTILATVSMLRRHIQVPANSAFYLFVASMADPERIGNRSILLCPSQTIGELYDQYKSADCLLYLTYSSEEAFGFA